MLCTQNSDCLEGTGGLEIDVHKGKRFDALDLNVNDSLIYSEAIFFFKICIDINLYLCIA